MPVKGSEIIRVVVTISMKWDWKLVSWLIWKRMTMDYIYKKSDNVTRISMRKRFSWNCCVKYYWWSQWYYKFLDTNFGKRPKIAWVVESKCTLANMEPYYLMRVWLGQLKYMLHRYWDDTWQSSLVFEFSTSRREHRTSQTIWNRWGWDHFPNVLIEC